MIRVLLAGLVLSLCLVPPMHAQEAEAAPDSAGKARRILTLPVPLLFRGDETGWGGGLSVMHVRRASDAERQRPSTYRASAVFTERGQRVLSMGMDRYAPGNRLRLSAGASHADFPTDFRGIGNDAPDAPLERYTPRTVSVSAGAEWQVRPGIFTGLGVSAGRVRIEETEPGGVLDRGLVVGGDGGSTVGLGVSLARDTRDGFYAPRSGSYARLSLSGTAGEFENGSLGLDGRLYHPLGPATVAVRGLGSFGTGEIPFYSLATMGGSGLMRGVRAGRFRDRHLLAAQGEVRLPVWNRLGVAAFAEAAEVAPSLGGFTADGVHVAGGGGLRWTIRRREGLNVRFDVGFSDGERRTYLSLGEAF